MIDRLVHHADVIALKGDSYRLKNRDLGRRPGPFFTRRIEVNTASRIQDVLRLSLEPASSPRGQSSRVVDTGYAGSIPVVRSIHP